MGVTPEQAATVFREAELLYSGAEVEVALDEMAAVIRARLAGLNPLLLCVMNGGVVMTGKLLPRLDFPLQLDSLHATRYRGETRGGALDWISKPTIPLVGRVLLLVDDILDEGITLKGIADYCRAQGAAQVLSAVLVDKRHDRKNGMQATFSGLAVADRYVFGYGMDYKDYLRNAAGIYAVRDSHD